MNFIPSGQKFVYTWYNLINRNKKIVHHCFQNNALNLGWIENLWSPWISMPRSVLLPVLQHQHCLGKLLYKLNDRSLLICKMWNKMPKCNKCCYLMVSQYYWVNIGCWVFHTDWWLRLVYELHPVDLEVWSKVAERAHVKCTALKWVHDFDCDWRRVNAFAHCVTLRCVLLLQIISYSDTKVPVLYVYELILLLHTSRSTEHRCLLIGDTNYLLKSGC